MLTRRRIRNTLQVGARLFLLRQISQLVTVLAPNAPVNPARIQALQNRITALETTIGGIRRRRAGHPDNDTRPSDQGTIGRLHNQVAE